MANQKLNIDIVARDRTKQALSGVQGALGRLKRSVFSLQSAFVGLGAGLVVRNLVSTGKELENLRVRLKFLLKDTNEGTKAFDNMVKFASKVPFSLQEIQAGSGILATVTDNADDLQKMLEITGNVAATTGLDFRTAAEQIQRSFSAGIGAADLFREKGVRNMLGFKAGATVSIEETVAAFERVFGKDGRFGKATDELAQTFEGTLSMIGDKIFNFKKVLLEAGFFEELKTQFGELDKFLANNAEQIDKIAVSLGQNLAKALIGIVDIGQKLVPFFEKVLGFLKNVKDGFFALPEVIQTTGLIGAVLLGKKGFVGLALITAAIDKANEFGEKFGDKGIKVKIEPFEHELSGNQQIAERNKLIRETAQLIEQARAKENELREEFLRTQQPIHDIVHDMSLIPESVKEAREEFLKTQQPIQDIIHDMSIEMPSAFQKAKEEAFGGFKEGLTSALDVSTFERFKEAGQKSLRSLQSSITDFIMTGKLSFKTLKEAIIRSIVEAMVGSVVQAAIKKGTALFKFEAIREGLISAYKAGAKALASIPFPLNIAAAGLVVGAGLKFVDKIKGFQKGGAVRKGQPILVGEQGAEMFVPNSTGQITQSARGTGGEAVTVNFNINAVDASGFEELLVRSRGTITQLINSAVNERGREALI